LGDDGQATAEVVDAERFDVDAVNLDRTFRGLDHSEDALE
jgi:hypothetical protein